MKSIMHWQGKMKFEAELDGHKVLMDTASPLGDDSAPSPKQLALTGLGGCTAMDVIALLKKYRQDVDSMSVELDAPLTEKHPKIFSSILVRYRINGAVDPEKAKEAVAKSMNLFCGVSAMFAKATTINYEIILNNEVVGTGQAFAGGPA